MFRLTYFLDTVLPVTFANAKIKWPSVNKLTKQNQQLCYIIAR